MKIKDVIRIIRSLESDCETTGVRQQETLAKGKKMCITSLLPGILTVHGVE